MKKARRNPRKGRIRTGVRILSTEVFHPCPRSRGPATLAPHAPPPPHRPSPRCSRQLAAPAALGAPAQVTRGRPRACHASGNRRSSRPSTRFTLAGIHWRGSGSVTFRTRSLAGRWSEWRPAAPEDEDGPDLGSRREPDAERLADRKPVVGRAVRPDRGAHERAGRASSRASRMEPRAPRPLPDSGCDGDPGDRAARFLGSG